MPPHGSSLSYFRLPLHALPCSYVGPALTFVWWLGGWAGTRDKRAVTQNGNGRARDGQREVEEGFGRAEAAKHQQQPHEVGEGAVLGRLCSRHKFGSHVEPSTEPLRATDAALSHMRQLSTGRVIFLTH